MAATEEVWMPREVQNNDRGTTYWNDGEYIHICINIHGIMYENKITKIKVRRL